MWENKIDEKVKRWKIKIKMGKPLRENPRANGLAEGRIHVPIQSQIPACVVRWESW
jgi:hypothetical protein